MSHTGYGRLLEQTSGRPQCDREPDALKLALERLGTRHSAGSRARRLVRVARGRPAAKRPGVGDAPRLGRTTCAPGAGAGHPGGGAGDAGGAVPLYLGWLACAAGLASYSTASGVVRSFLRPARRLLASRRRRRAPAVGLVGRRGAGLTAARRRSATSRSSASWRLRSWVR